MCCSYDCIEMGLPSVLLECTGVSEMWAVKWSVKFRGFDCLKTHACDLITGAEVKLQGEKMYRRKRKTKVERWRVDYHASPVDCPINYAYHNVRGTHRYAFALNAPMFAQKAQILIHPVVSFCSGCYFVILDAGLLAEKSREWSKVTIIQLLITCYKHLIVEHRASCGHFVVRVACCGDVSAVIQIIWESSQLNSQSIPEMAIYFKKQTSKKIPRHHCPTHNTG